MQQKKNDKSRLRPDNLALITDRHFFHCLRNYGAMSRAAISQMTGISRPTVSESANRLVSLSLVVETQRRTQNKQGRAGILYEVNAARGITIGVAMDSDKVQVRVTNLANETLREQAKNLPVHLTQQLFIDIILETISDTIAGINSPVLAIGVSVADPVNASTGQVIPLPNSPFPIAHGIDFLALFSDVFNCVVTIDNDVNLATLAESNLGIAKEQQNLLFVYFGKGIGSGIYLGGRLIRGGAGMAGEIGYIKVSEGRNLQDFVEEVNLEKDILAGKSLEAHPAIGVIAHVIASTATVINPDMVVLGGPLSQHSSFSNALKQQIQTRVLSETLIVPSTMPDTAPLAGAALSAHELALLSLGLLDPIDDVSQTGYSTLWTQ